MKWASAAASVLPVIFAACMIQDGVNGLVAPTYVRSTVRSAVGTSCVVSTSHQQRAGGIYTHCPNRQFLSALHISGSATSVSDAVSSDDGDDDGDINGGAGSSSNNVDTKAKVNGSAPALTKEQPQPEPQPQQTQTKSPTAEVSRFRRLKDYMWIRETLEDLTAAEFACSVEAMDSSSSSVSGSSSSTEASADSSNGEQREKNRQRRKRAVDYEKLVGILDGRIVDMVGGQSLKPKPGDQPVLLDNCGMGRVVYDIEQRQRLLDRITVTKNALNHSIKRNNMEIDAESDTSASSFELKLPEIPGIRVEIPKAEAPNAAAAGPKLYVRDDGTVDWEGALQDREALKMLGGAVWQRINGRTPKSIEDDENNKQEKKGGKRSEEKPPTVTAKIQDTPEIIAGREELTRLTEQLRTMQREHTALLSSGIRTGQAVANVKMASLDPALRNRIRESALVLEQMEQSVSFQTLVYELERIYAYLVTELGNPESTGYVPLQDRLNVAEFGLLESQVESFHKELERKSSIDEDILAVVMEQLTDFKRRLGIDYYVTGLTFDREAIALWLNDIVTQTKNGVGFYIKGCQLFWDDIVYSLGLIARAAQGYTLKPREVQTIRRTFKDIITFIPVVIILIIPLSPVGHVLVFGAIQRVFPEFFPSCFTEQRQNLLKLYETTEFSEFTINETWQEKIIRIFEAIGFFLVSKSKSFYSQLTGPSDAADSDEQSKTKQ